MDAQLRSPDAAQRHQRVYARLRRAISAFTRVFDALWRRGALLSGVHAEVPPLRRTAEEALHRVRDTSLFSLRRGCLTEHLPIGSARVRPPNPPADKIRMLGRPKFVLASGSPRRLSLLNQAGIEPDALRPADVDETPKRGELPRACANRLARAKADAALKSVQLDDELRGAFILAADTVVAVGRRILPKAGLVDEASQCLRLLSGRNHRVYTAICLVTPKESFRQRLIETRVRFKRLSEDDIQAYIGSGEWRGKAGGYAVQGIAGSFVVKMVGSYSNIVGLPLYETTALLGGEGFPIRFGWLNAS
jgi:nucleoside triphosphate pyrophosphatase